jgi:hypothetical protein
MLTDGVWAEVKVDGEHLRLFSNWPSLILQTATLACPKKILQGIVDERH